MTNPCLRWWKRTTRETPEATMPTPHATPPLADLLDNPRLDAALADPPPELPAIHETAATPISEAASAYADAWRDEIQRHGARVYIRTADIRSAAGLALTRPTADAIRTVFGQTADVPTLTAVLRDDERALRDYQATIETILAAWACDQRIRLAAQRAAHYLRHRARHQDADADPARTP